MVTKEELESMTHEEREAYWRSRFKNWDDIKAFGRVAGSVKGPCNAVELCREERYGVFYDDPTL